MERNAERAEKKDKAEARRLILKRLKELRAAIKRLPNERLSDALTIMALLGGWLNRKWSIKPHPEYVAIDCGITPNGQVTVTRQGEKWLPLSAEEKSGTTAEIMATMDRLDELIHQDLERTDEARKVRMHSENLLQDAMEERAAVIAQLKSAHPWFWRRLLHQLKAGQTPHCLRQTVFAERMQEVLEQEKQGCDECQRAVGITLQANGLALAAEAHYRALLVFLPEGLKSLLQDRRLLWKQTPEGIVVETLQTINEKEQFQVPLKQIGGLPTALNIALAINQTNELTAADFARLLQTALKAHQLAASQGLGSERPPANEGRQTLGAPPLEADRHLDQCPTGKGPTAADLTRTQLSGRRRNTEESDDGTQMPPAEPVRAEEPAQVEGAEPESTGEGEPDESDDGKPDNAVEPAEDGDNRP